MQIVAPSIEHLAPLGALMRATFAETFGHLYPAADLAAYLDTAYAPERLRAELADPRNYWQLVLDAAGAPVAYLECVPAHLPHPDVKPEAHGEIERLYVLRSHQGKGLGRILMARALAYLGERYDNAPQWLGVWSENLRAQTLYRSYGFNKAGEYIFPVGDTQDVDFIFRRCP